MANNCILCGEEIPEDQAICDTCRIVLDSLPPDRAKNLVKVIEDEEARIKFRAAIRDVKQQIKIALDPVFDAIHEFVDILLAVTEDDDNGK